MKFSRQLLRQQAHLIEGWLSDECLIPLIIPCPKSGVRVGVGIDN